MAQKLIKAKSRTKARYLKSSIGLAEKVMSVTGALPRSKDPDFKPGDNVKVHVKIKEGEKERIQIFEGVIIKVKGRGATGAITVRKMSHGVGVERVFRLNSPKVAKIEIVQKGKVRRAKLYYLRKLTGRAAKIDKDSSSRATRGSASGKSTTDSSAK